MDDGGPPQADRRRRAVLSPLYRPGVKNRPPDTFDVQTFDVVFVCTGNRARSPLAEAFLAALVEPSRVTVGSRGTLNAGSNPALTAAVTAGTAHGVDLSGHRSTSLRAGELSDTDLVVGFEPFHVAAAVMEGGASYSRAFTILELADLLERLEQGGVLPVRLDPGAVVVKAHGVRSGPVLAAPALADPLGATQKEFDRVAATIERLVTTISGALFASRTRRADVA